VFVFCIYINEIKEVFLQTDFT